MLRFGYAKAKFTANATYRQILVVQAAQAVKADALKAHRQASAAVATKEAASAAVNAEAATEKVEMIAGDLVVRVLVTAVAAAVRAAVALTGQVVRVAVEAVRVAIVQAVREKDRNKTDLRFEI